MCGNRWKYAICIIGIGGMDALEEIKYEEWENHMMKK